MGTAHDIEDNAISYYQVISQALGGQFHQDGQVVWFITGRRSLARFNAVLRSPLYQRMGFETIITGDLYTCSGATRQEVE